MKKYITDYINKFIPFDISNIFDYGDAVVFGGAVRDSIAQFPIHDVDIIALGQTAKRIDEFLKSKDYHTHYFNTDSPDHNSIRTNAYQIEWFNVITYTQKSSKYHFMSKADKNFYVPIQIIRPLLGHFFLSKEGQREGFPNVNPKNMSYFSQDILEKVKTFIVEEVDIACCGVSVSGNGFKETVSGAVSDCQKHKLTVKTDGVFYNPERTEQRVGKLVERGWNNPSYFVSPLKLKSEIINNPSSNYWQTTWA